MLVATKLEALTKEHIARKPELTVVADTFCHFYLLDFESQTAIKEYMKRMRLPVMQRLPGYKKGGAPSALKKLVSRVVKTHRITKTSSFVDVALAASHEATGKNLKDSFHEKSAHGLAHLVNRVGGAQSSKGLREVQALVEHAFDNPAARPPYEASTKHAIRQSMGAIRQSTAFRTASGVRRPPDSPPLEVQPQRTRRARRPRARAPQSPGLLVARAAAPPIVAAAPRASACRTAARARAAPEAAPAATRRPAPIDSASDWHAGRSDVPRIRDRTRSAS